MILKRQFFLPQMNAENADQAINHQQLKLALLVLHLLFSNVRFICVHLRSSAAKSF
jgi:hypothetical protein